MEVKDIENEYGRVIQELSGGCNSLIIKCTCADEMRMVASVAIEKLHAIRDSITIDEVSRGNDEFWNSSYHKWVKISSDPYGDILMHGFRPCDTTGSHITADEFIAAFDDPVQSPSEQEFSDLFQELIL